MTLRRSLGIIVEWTVADIRVALRHALRMTLAGSPYMPRVGRFVLYRIARIRTQSANIFPGVIILGAGHHLTIGTRSAINSGCTLDLEGPITIGVDALIGNRVTILTSVHELVDGTVQRQPTSRPVVIGDRVWVGAEVLIMPGVTIHSDVIVAAGAVVTKDCLANGIYAGVPAKRIKELEQPDS